MFIYNLKLNKKTIKNIFILACLVIIIAIISFSIYIIFFKDNSNRSCLNNPDEIFEINEDNYTNILKASNENIDNYVGCKVHVVGYVYRLLDFDKNQFVVARDMKYDSNGQSLVVGFLCNYDKAYDFADGTWVDIDGEIVKGNFNGDIAILNVLSIKEAEKPQNIFVAPPDGKGDGSLFHS